MSQRFPRPPRPPRPVVPSLGEVLGGALPTEVSRRLPPPGLLSAWRELAGAEVARRAHPVCLEPGEDGEEGGTLVVAVAGSAWRQELALAAPRLAEGLRGQGFPVARLRLVKAAAPPPERPQAPPRRLEPEEEAAVERQVQEVRDPGLRAALGRAMRAQLQAGPESD